MRFLATIFLLGIAFLVGGTPVFADDALQVSVEPQYFQPFSTVTLTPQSDVFSLDGAAVTVTANGKVVAKGSGAEPVQITLGGVGKTTSVSVSAATPDKTYTTSVRLTPEDVALVIEPMTTTHPFYLGGNAVTPQSRARLVAFADFRTSTGVRIDPAKLIYTWSVGDQSLAAQSGIGKSVLPINAPVQYRDALVSVTITSQDQTLVGGASMDISPVTPLVRIYKNDPLLGPDFNTALSDSFSMTDSEDTFRVVPYFFSKLPMIAWTVNSVESGTDNDLTVRPTGTGAGSAALGVSATDAGTFQTASQNLSVTFGAAKPLGIFGL
jgi:hypothetical protein